MKPNEVFGGLLEAMQEHGLRWHWYIGYDDYPRVMMQLQAMMNQLETVMEPAIQETWATASLEQDRLQDAVNQQHIGPSNPRASFAAERFEHT